jgi:hypothetical protein
MSLTVVSIHKIIHVGYSVSLEDNLKGCKIKNKDGKTTGKTPASSAKHKWLPPRKNIDFLMVNQRLDAIRSLVRANQPLGCSQ